MSAPATAPATGSIDTSILTDDVLQRFHERAATYDRENRFFHEDFDELVEAGYLTINVPVEFGGRGCSLPEVCQLQRRLAYYAPATALATNMHLVWTGTAADLFRMGDTSLTWLLDEAMRGEVFASGHAERGNDLPGLFSTARAERVDGGYRFYGRKMFGSLSPVWTRLCAWAMEGDNPNGPQMVHAAITRDSGGYHIEETWDTMAMRATASQDTVLDGVFVPDSRVMRTLPAGEADAFLLSSLGTFELTCASVYLGIADRALDLAIADARQKSSLALTRPMAYHPEVQHLIAEAVMVLDGATPHVEQVARDWATGVDYGPAWLSKLVSAKHHGVTAAQRVVDIALTTSGGAGMFRGNELERLYRDASAGRFHPANSLLAHEVVGKTALGIAPSEQPRWG